MACGGKFVRILDNLEGMKEKYLKKTEGRKIKIQDDLGRDCKDRK